MKGTEYTIREDCRYWWDSCGLCGITGNNYCPRKCKDYTVNDCDYDREDE